MPSKERTWREKIRAAQDGVDNAYLNRGKVFSQAIQRGFTYEEVAAAAGGMSRGNVHKIVASVGGQPKRVTLDDPFDAEADDE